MFSNSDITFSPNDKMFFLIVTRCFLICLIKHDVFTEEQDAFLVVMRSSLSKGNSRLRELHAVGKLTRCLVSFLMEQGRMHNPDVF